MTDLLSLEKNKDNFLDRITDIEARLATVERQVIRQNEDSVARLVFHNATTFTLAGSGSPGLHPYSIYDLAGDAVPNGCVGFLCRIHCVNTPTLFLGAIRAWRTTNIYADVGVMQATTTGVSAYAGQYSIHINPFSGIFETALYTGSSPDWGMVLMGWYINDTGGNN